MKFHDEQKSIIILVIDLLVFGPLKKRSLPEIGRSRWGRQKHQEFNAAGRAHLRPKDKEAADEGTHRHLQMNTSAESSARSPAPKKLADQLAPSE